MRGFGTVFSPINATSLTKKIGFWPSVALVTGNMIGAGIFLLPATMASYQGIGIIGWIIASAGALILAFIFGQLSKLYPNTNGGPYAYTKIGLGDFAGFLVAWGYWISIWCTNAAIAVALVGYLGAFFPSLTESPVLSSFTGLFFIWFFTWINSKDIKTIGAVQVATTILKVIPIAFLILVGVFYVDFSKAFIFPFTTGSILPDITAVTTLTFFAFLGMESATVPSSAITSPETTIPKATLFGTLLTTVLYLFSFIVIIGIIPPETLAQSTAPFADTAFEIWGTTGKYLVAFGAVASTMGALNGWILLQGQIPAAAAKDKLFPKLFQKTNTNGSPILGIIFSSVLATLLMLSNYSKTLVEAFTYMMKLSTLTVLLPYLFSIATFALALKNTNTKSIILACLAFLFSLWIVIGCGAEIVFLGFLLLLLGIPVYVYLKKRQ